MRETNYLLPYIFIFTFCLINPVMTLISKIIVLVLIYLSIHPINSQVIGEETIEMEVEMDGLDEFHPIYQYVTFEDCPNRYALKGKKCFERLLKDHITTTMKYPKKAKRKKQEGIVKVSFTVNKSGEVINIESEGGSNLLNLEAERIISLLPVLYPAKKRGRPLELKIETFIKFTLEN